MGSYQGGQMVEGGEAVERAKALPNLLQILSAVNILQCKYFIKEIFQYFFFVETEILKFFCLSFGVVLSFLGGVHQN